MLYKDKKNPGCSMPWLALYLLVRCEANPLIHHVLALHHAFLEGASEAAHS